MLKFKTLILLFILKFKIIIISYNLKTSWLIATTRSYRLVFWHTDKSSKILHHVQCSCAHWLHKFYTGKDPHTLKVHTTPQMGCNHFSSKYHRAWWIQHFKHKDGALALPYRAFITSRTLAQRISKIFLKHSEYSLILIYIVYTSPIPREISYSWNSRMEQPAKSRNFHWHNAHLVVSFRVECDWFVYLQLLFSAGQPKQVATPLRYWT